MIQNFFIFKLLISLLFLSSCSTGPEFKRDNETDPKSGDFKPDISALSVKLNNDKTVSLSWTDNSGFEDGIVIAKSFGDNGPIEIIDTLSANSVSYTDHSKLLDKYTTYHIGAFKDGANPIDSSRFISKKLDLGEFTDVSVEISDVNNTTVNWYSELPFADSFVIQKRTALNNEITVVDTIDGSNSFFSYTETDETYSVDIFVHALLKNAEGEFQEIAAIDTSDISINLPSNLIVDVIDEETIQVSWHDNSPFDEQFIVYQSEPKSQFREGNGPYHAIDTLSSENNVIINHSEQIFYEFSIAPIKNGVTGKRITPVILVLNTTAPEITQIESISETEFILNWNDNNYGNINDYRYPTKRFVLERSINKGPFEHYKTLGENISSIHIKDLDPNSHYKFRIRTLSTAYDNVEVAFVNSIVEEKEFDINSWDSPRTLESTPLGTYFVYEYSHSAGSYGLKLLNPEDGSMVNHLYFDSDFRDFSFSLDEKYVAIFGGIKPGVYEYEDSYEVPVYSYDEEAKGVFINDEEIIISSRTHLIKINVSENSQTELSGFEEIIAEKPHFNIFEIYSYKTNSKIIFNTTEGIMAYDFVEHEVIGLSTESYKITDTNTDGEILFVEENKITLMNDEGIVLNEYTKPESIDNYYLNFINAKFAFGNYIVVGTTQGMLILFNKETAEYISYHHISYGEEKLYNDIRLLAISKDGDKILVFFRNLDGLAKFFTSTEGWTTISYEQ